MYLYIIIPTKIPTSAEISGKCRGEKNPSTEVSKCEMSWYRCSLLQQCTVILCAENLPFLSHLQEKNFSLGIQKTVHVRKKINSNIKRRWVIMRYASSTKPSCYHNTDVICCSQYVTSGKKGNSLKLKILKVCFWTEITFTPFICEMTHRKMFCFVL